MIYRLSVVLNKIPAGFFTEIDKLILKFTRKFKGPRGAKTISKKNKAGRLKFSDFKNQIAETQQSRLGNSAVRTNIQNNGIELRVQK